MAKDDGVVLGTPLPARLTASLLLPLLHGGPPAAERPATCPSGCLSSSSSWQPSRLLSLHLPRAATSAQGAQMVRMRKHVQLLLQTRTVPSADADATSTDAT